MTAAPLLVSPPADSSPPSFPRGEPPLVVGTTAVLVALVMRHVRGVNGPWYWHWMWRRLPWIGLYPLMLVAAAPFVAAQWAYLRGRVKSAVALLALATLCLQFAALAFQPPAG